MAEYRVIWEIDVDADSPKEAAIEALKIQQDTFSEALFFQVTNSETREVTEVDLLTETPLEDDHG